LRPESCNGITVRAIVLALCGGVGAAPDAAR
jgi:hypothetical protein